MATGASYVVQYRRKREGRTDYKKRLEMLKSRKARLVVRLSGKRVLAQIVTYLEDGDNVIAAADSSDLKEYGWKYSGKNLPAAYLTAYLCAKRSLSKGVNEAVLDIGLHPSIKGSRIYSALKGAVDAGLDVPKDDSVIPDVKRIAGEDIARYASSMDKNSYEKKFSGYLKAGADPKNMPQSHRDVKDKIEKSFHK